MRSIVGGEGLWPLDRVDVPLPVRRAARGVVRVGSHIRFRVDVHETSEAAASARARPEALAKRFLAGGGVEWPVITDHVTLAAICASAAHAAQPGFHEICAAYSKHELDPGPFLTGPLRDGATGFAIEGPGDELRVVTNYHVAREGIERAGRAGGEYDSRPLPCLDAWVADEAGDRARLVMLEANASEADWGAGRDWAVLRTDLSAVSAVSAQPLDLRVRPARIGERVWVLGFPTRTVRSQRAYPDANGTLRVASGTITDVNVDRLVSDVDGVAGNSGSPVVDEFGQVVGIFADHDHRDGEFDLRISGYGGRTFITPVACLPVWLPFDGVR